MSTFGADLIDSLKDAIAFARGERFAMRILRRARAAVISDPDIMGGDPVFRGTRIPVHLIATLLGQGSTIADLLDGYPRLTAEMARFAPIYAAAYPLPGQPRVQPWHDQPPALSTRRKLATIEVL